MTMHAGREIPVTVIDSGESVAAEAHAHHHAHADEGPRSLGSAPPCYLHVGDTAIDEAAIAQEMQYHRDADKHDLSDALSESIGQGVARGRQ